MMKKIAALALIGSIFSLPAAAADSGFYVAADLGMAQYSGDTRSAFTSASFEDPGVIVIGGGFRLNPYVGVEANYNAFGESVIETYGFGAYAKETLKTSAFQAAAIGRYPIGNKFELFAKLGVTNLKMEYTMTSTFGGDSQSTSKTNLLAGIGGQFNINPRFGIRVQYQDLGKVTFTDPATGIGINIGAKTFTAGGVFNF